MSLTMGDLADGVCLIIFYFGKVDRFISLEICKI